MKSSNTGLSVTGATVRFAGRAAVDNVSLSVERGGSIGIVGESGSGKTTLARAIVGQQELDAGDVTFDGVRLVGRRSVEQRRAIQMVYQDPYSSLNPRLTVRQTLRELLRVHRLVSRDGLDARCAELMGMVRFSAEALDAYPAQFSGGQRQRIALARALAVEPQVLVADEPTSALDASVQASVVDLLSELRRDLGLTLVFVSHDLGVINALCDTIVVMRSGQVVETAARAEFFAHPREQYSRELLAAVPRLSARDAPGEAGSGPGLAMVPAASIDSPKSAAGTPVAPANQDQPQRAISEE